MCPRTQNCSQRHSKEPKSVNVNEFKPNDNKQVGSKFSTKWLSPNKMGQIYIKIK